MSIRALQQIEGMEDSREEMFQEMLDLPVGSKDRGVAHNSIAAITNLIDYHRKRLVKVKPRIRDANYEK